MTRQITRRYRTFAQLTGAISKSLESCASFSIKSTKKKYNRLSNRLSLGCETVSGTGRYRCTQRGPLSMLPPTFGLLHLCGGGSTDAPSSSSSSPPQLTDEGAAEQSRPAAATLTCNSVLSPGGGDTSAGSLVFFFFSGEVRQGVLKSQQEGDMTI